jgi:organic hydroperoxide reductase OsmC/OhrA
MAQHTATIRWTRTGPDFLKGQYSREHLWLFDGGATVPASPSPHNVPLPWCNPASVDPEEAFVASVSSCHMLTYVWLASRAGFQVDSYEDRAVGEMAKNEKGAAWIGKVTLDPKIKYSGAKLPSPTDESRLHNEAHEQCFIANSIKTEVVVSGLAPH